MYFSVSLNPIAGMTYQSSRPMAMAEITATA
jgi:hypothetical protein